VRRSYKLALVLVACWAAFSLQTAPARADVLVTIYNGNPGGAGNGGPNLDFSGLQQIGQPFQYYGLAFGVEAQAGGGNPNGDWRPFYHDVNYSAQITGQFNVASAGVYTFSTRSDDGSILRIDNQVVVNNNFFQAPTTRTGTVSLAAGIHNFQVQFFQGGGGKSLDVGSALSVNQLPAGVTIVNHNNVPQLTTTVFNDAGPGGPRFNFSTGAVINPNAPVIGTFITPAVNFDFGSGSRWSPFGVSNNYSDSTTGFLIVDRDGVFRFGLNSDDGSFLSIDGNQVINNGFFQGSNQNGPFGMPQVIADVFLTAGPHAFEVDHFQGGGGAGVTLFLPDFFGEEGVRFATPQDIIPEPATLSLLGVGLGGFLAARYWRRRGRKDH
jgi:hypothetical protein